MAELTEQELTKKMSEISQKKQKEFVDKVNKLSSEYGLTFAGQPVIDQDGRVRANVVLTPRQDGN